MIKKVLAVLALTLAVCLLPTAAWGYSTADISGAPIVRVMLDSSYGYDSYSFTVTNGTYYIVAEDSLNGSSVYRSYMTVYDKISSGGSFTMSAGSGRIAVPENRDCTCKYGYYSYRGGFKAVTSGTYSYCINQLDVESYLYGIIGNEISEWNDDSMKAQAVAARSYAIANISSDNRYYDVTGSVYSQVYRGYSSESARIRAAVDETCGWILTYKGEVVEAYYSASNGGHSENIENVWIGEDVPLVGVYCPYDKVAGTDPYYGSYAASCWSWTEEYSPDNMVSLANNYGNTDIGEFVSVSMSTTYNGQTSVSGRAMQVTIKGTRDSVTATKDEIRSLLNLKSTLFTFGSDGATSAGTFVLSKGDKLTGWTDLNELFAVSGSGSVTAAGGSDSSIYVLSESGSSRLSKSAGTTSTTVSGNVVINGHGYGHGVGMSQWGAIAMGDNGFSWREIIDLFYCRDGIKLECCY